MTAKKKVTRKAAPKVGPSSDLVAMTNGDGQVWMVKPARVAEWEKQGFSRA